jgi:hypothetical protein
MAIVVLKALILNPASLVVLAKLSYYRPAKMRQTASERLEHPGAFRRVHGWLTMAKFPSMAAFQRASQNLSARGHPIKKSQSGPEVRFWEFTVFPAAWWRYQSLVTPRFAMLASSGEAAASLRVMLVSTRATDKMNSRNDDRRHRRSPRPPAERQSTRQRATDQEIQKWISRQHGFVPESAWLAHCKEQFGLAPPGTSPNENPCPPEKVAAIKQAFRRFGLL